MPATTKRTPTPPPPYPVQGAAQALASTMDADEREAFARNLESADLVGRARVVRMAAMTPEERRRYRAARAAGIV